MPLRVEEHHAATIGGAALICCCNAALRTDGHAHHIALGDMEEAKNLRARIERALSSTTSFERVDPRGLVGQERGLVKPSGPNRIRQHRQTA